MTTPLSRQESLLADYQQTSADYETLSKQYATDLAAFTLHNAIPRLEAKTEKVSTIIIAAYEEAMAERGFVWTRKRSE